MICYIGLEVMTKSPLGTHNVTKKKSLVKSSFSIPFPGSDWCPLSKLCGTADSPKIAGSLA